MLKNFFKKQKKESSENKNILVAALLIHAAKIDEKYTDVEKKIIKQTLLELGANQLKIDQLILTAENNEQKSNQILPKNLQTPKSMSK